MMSHNQYFDEAQCRDATSDDEKEEEDGSTGSLAEFIDNRSVQKFQMRNQLS